MECCLLQAETKFVRVQEERRRQHRVLEGIQSRMRTISGELEKTRRSDSIYLELVQKEHGLFCEESELLDSIKQLELVERESFSVLSSALRDSHEKERSRAERTKYWSIIGSVVGAVIGISSSSLNNYIKMRELSKMTVKFNENNEDLRTMSLELVDSMQMQTRRLENLLHRINSTSSSDNSETGGVITDDGGTTGASSTDNGDTNCGVSSHLASGVPTSPASNRGKGWTEDKVDTGRQSEDPDVDSLTVYEGGGGDMAYDKDGDAGSTLKDGDQDILHRTVVSSIVVMSVLSLTITLFIFLRGGGQ